MMSDQTTIDPALDSRTVEDGQECHAESHTWFQHLTDEIVRTAGHISAMECYFIELISEYDKFELWRVENSGFKSFAHWLNARCGINPLVAREKIRVARRLRHLDHITKAFHTGRISYSKVRALTRVATPENETLLLDEALSLTAAQLEQRVRRYKKVETDQDKQKPYISCWQDDDGMFHFHARLEPEDGALLENAIERMINKGGSEGPDALPSTHVQEEVEEDSRQDRDRTPSTKNVSAETFFGGRRSRALVGIAEHFLATAQEGAQSLSSGEKNHVIIHVNANEAHRDCQINGGTCTFTDRGQFLAPEVARRLACDAAITTVVEDDDGNVLNIGRRSRLLTRAIDLAVDIRDNFTCQHPWCYQTRHTQKHHIEPWSSGGETSVNNLITLCQRHHTLQHEGKFEIERIEHEDGSYHFEFVDRDGEIIEAGADPQFPDYKSAEEIVPMVELDPSLIIGRKLSAFEQRTERNRAEIEASLLFYRR